MFNFAVNCFLLIFVFVFVLTFVLFVVRTANIQTLFVSTNFIQTFLQRKYKLFS